MHRGETLYEAFAVLHYGAKFLGLSPYRWVNNEYKMSKLGTTITCCAAILHSVNGIVVLKDSIDVWPNVIILIITRIKLFVSFFSTLIIYISELTNRVRLESIMDDLHSIDLMLQNYGVIISYRSTKSDFMVAMAIVYIFSVSITILDFVSYWKGPLQIYWIQFALLFIIPAVVHGCFTCLFCCYIFVISQRFKLINKQILIKALNSNNKRTFRVRTRYTEKGVIESVKIIHLDLCILIEKLNSMYSLQLLCLTVIGYCNILSQIYIWISTAYHRHYEYFDPRTFTHACLVFLFTVLPLFIIMICSENCINEGKKTRNILIRMAMDSENEIVINSLKSFVLQMEFRPKNLTAAGFFELNRKVLGTMVGSAITYIIVLLQFDLNIKQ